MIKVESGLIQSIPQGMFFLLDKYDVFYGIFLCLTCNAVSSSTHYISLDHHLHEWFSFGMVAVAMPNTIAFIRASGR